MKRASCIHRLTLLLLALTVASLALAGGPPPHAQGAPPPFSEDDCIFENGRTMCVVVESEGERELLSFEGAAIVGTCPSGAPRIEIVKIYGWPVTVTRTTFFGSSHQIESTDVAVYWTEEEIAESECLAL